MAEILPDIMATQQSPLPFATIPLTYNTLADRYFNPGARAAAPYPSAAMESQYCTIMPVRRCPWMASSLWCFSTMARLWRGSKLSDSNGNTPLMWRRFMCGVMLTGQGFGTTLKPMTFFCDAYPRPGVIRRLLSLHSFSYKNKEGKTLRDVCLKLMQRNRCWPKKKKTGLMLGLILTVLGKYQDYSFLLILLMALSQLKTLRESHFPKQRTVKLLLKTLYLSWVWRSTFLPRAK